MGIEDSVKLTHTTEHSVFVIFDGFGGFGFGRIYVRKKSLHTYTVEFYPRVSEETRFSEQLEDNEF